MIRQEKTKFKTPYLPACGLFSRTILLYYRRLARGCGSASVYKDNRKPVTLRMKNNGITDRGNCGRADVRLSGGFLGPFIRRIRDVVLPYQWEVLNDRVETAEPSHCMENFRVASGRSRGEHYGMVFQDSDAAKWLEAVACQLAQARDDALEKAADEAIEEIVAAQQPDGYLDTYYICTGLDKRWTNLKDHHELYCAGHMMEAGVAYYQATGKRRLLDAMIRLADHIDGVFGPKEGQLKGYPGHEEIELALCKLYDVTGEARYLRLAEYFINQRGAKPDYFEAESARRGEASAYREFFGPEYFQNHLPVREQATAEGHAVRLLYLLSGMADVAARTGDASLWAACERLYGDVTKRRMYVTGGVGSTHVGEAVTFDYDLPNDTVYGETCASIALIFAARRMLAHRPDGCFGDVMDRALYNTCLASMSLDGKHFFYVNPLEVVPEASRRDPGKRHVLPVRPAWFGCACCPPNLARLLSSLGSYQYDVSGRDVYAHLYLNGEADLVVDGCPVSLRMETEYPADGRIRIRAGAGDYVLRLRIPAWCDDFHLTRNGAEVPAKPENGYVSLPGPFGGDRLELTLPMPACRCYASPLVRADTARVCVTRGPVVYCLEEADNGRNLHLLELPKSAALRCLPDGTVVAEGSRLTPTGDALYTRDVPWRRDETKLTFIPYYRWANRGENEMTVWVRESE